MIRNSRSVFFKFLFLLTAVVFASALGAAQYGGGRDQYQILAARYGTADRNVDVTPKLKDLARRNATFRMGNSTFGIDPDPGHKKTLRIYTKDRSNGRNRMFEYPEGAVVDGSVFSGWNSGNWGPGGWNGGWGGPPPRPMPGGPPPGPGGPGRPGRDEYTILQARYGTAYRNVDVTPKLKDLARRNATFRMGNSTFGIDPDPGHKKTLRIYTRDRGGRSRMFEYPEGATIDGTIFSGWNSGNWGAGGWNGGW